MVKAPARPRDGVTEHRGTDDGTGGEEVLTAEGVDQADEGCVWRWRLIVRPATKTHEKQNRAAERLKSVKSEHFAKESHGLTVRWNKRRT